MKRDDCLDLVLVAIKSPLGLIICAEKTAEHVELCKLRPARYVIKASKG
jgi:hypothetical protein